MALRTDFVDYEDVLYAEIFNSHAETINALQTDLQNLQSEVDNIPGANDATLANLVNNPASLVHGALASHFTTPTEVKGGPPPVGAVNAQAGTGAQILYGGTRTSMRVAVLTGASPVQGGILCDFTLTGYVDYPTITVTAADVSSYAVGAVANILSTTSMQIVATSEVEPATLYVFNVLILGV